jgi:hypothetical protein
MSGKNVILNIKLRLGEENQSNIDSDWDGKDLLNIGVNLRK